MQAETDGRRREHYSSFDLEAYQARSAQATAWLEDKLDGSGGPDDVYTLTPRLHSNSGESVNENAGRNGDNSSIGEICTDICTEETAHLHRLSRTQNTHPGVSDPSPCVCEIRAGANIPTIPKDISLIRKRPATEGLLKCKVECKGVQRSVKCKRMHGSTPATTSPSRRRRRGPATPATAGRRLLKAPGLSQICRVLRGHVSPARGCGREIPPVNLTGTPSGRYGRGGCSDTRHRL